MCNESNTQAFLFRKRFETERFENSSILTFKQNKPKTV